MMNFMHSYRSLVLSETNWSDSSEEQASFFKLYAVLLNIDSLASFVYGRRYTLIKDFFYYYLYLVMDKKDDEQAIKTAKENLIKHFREYAEKFPTLKIFSDKQRQRSNYFCLFSNNQNLSVAFKEFVDAVEQYEKWRSLLNEEQIRTIYKKNLEDRQKYYTNEIGTFDELNDELIQSVKFDNNKILKQTLIEFHNAISHLVVVYYGQSDSKKNIQRAINHFRRGALDSYKAIIKDFYHIRDNNAYNPLDDLKNIREQEYKNIGKDVPLCNYYKKLTDKIIATYHS